MTPFITARSHQTMKVHFLFAEHASEIRLTLYGELYRGDNKIPSGHTIFGIPSGWGAVWKVLYGVETTQAGGVSGLK